MTSSLPPVPVLPDESSRPRRVNAALHHAWRGRPTLRTASLVLLFLLALVPRLLLTSAPIRTTDSMTYLTVAENMERNHCVSLSPPAGGQCLPHYGGNSLPGYPAFLAAAGSAIGASDRLALLLQAIAASVAITYLLWALARWTGDQLVLWAVGLALVISPLTLGWTRYVMSEALASALTLWVLAELIRSETDRRLRILPLAAGMAAAFFVRYDSVALGVGVLVMAVYIHGFAKGLGRTLLVALLALIPFGAWTIRSVAVGISPLPTPVVMPSIFNVRPPVGGARFFTRWAVDQNDVQKFLWPLLGGHYTQMSVPAGHFTASEQRTIETTLAPLAKMDAQPLPAAIDRRLGELGDQWKARHPWTAYVVVPVERLRHLLTDLDQPLSFGWAPEINDHPRLSPLLNAYRIALISLLAILFLATPRRSKSHLLLGVAGSTVVVRLLLLIALAELEVRYLVPIYGLVEAAVVVALVELLRNGRVSALTTGGMHREMIVAGSAQPGIPSTATSVVC